MCFLDIQMPRLNGFEVLARVPRQPIVVFTTAYDQYALDAFAVNSVDYLLKPVEARDLERALAKVERLGAATGPGCSRRGSATDVLGMRRWGQGGPGSRSERLSWPPDTTKTRRPKRRQSIE